MRCREPGCKKLRTFGQAFCGTHEKPPLTLKQQIASGPRFVAVTSVVPCVCGSSGGQFVDEDSGLCLKCWRHWRWSPIRER